jgi:hypothetical protein
MKIEEKFNKRSADLVEVQLPSVHLSPFEAELGIKLKFFTLRGSDDLRTLAMHMTPDEGLEMVALLVDALRRVKR